MIPRTALCAALPAALTLALALTPAAAADYPTRPIRMLVPFAAGGSADLVARIVAADAAPRLGQPIVIENRVGADGYTILIGSSTIAIVRTLTPDLPNDLMRDLALVMKVGSGAFVMAVADTSPVKTVQDLIAAAKARPTQLNFCTAASGSSTHLAGELFNIRSGIQVQHIGYKGEPQALTALVGNEVNYVVASYDAAAPFLQGGRVRVIAVTSPFRMKSLPNIPSVAEAGLPNFDAGYWNGIFVTGKTPPDVVDKLYGAMADAAKTPATTGKLENLGLRVEATGPKAFATELAADVEKWAGVIRTAKVTAQ